MDKSTWIAAKIKKLLADGTAKTEEQATAIAEKMWADMTPDERMKEWGMMGMSVTPQPKTIKMPILPAVPSDALLGKKITQEMIDGALKYDPKFRPSYVYLNETSAHNNEGNANSEVLAQVLRTFKENDHIVAEVLPQRKYRDGKFEELAAADGSHPGRSIDLWPKDLIPGSPSEFYLEGIALCGATKPATVNLPAIYYSAETESGVLTFALHTKPYGDETMPEDPKPDQKVDFAAVQKQLKDQDAKIEQLSADVKTLSAERDHYKTEAENLGQGFKELKAKADRQEVEALLDSADYRGKVKSDERDGVVELALSLKADTVQLSAGKSRFDAYMESIKNRNVMVNLGIVGGHLGVNVGTAAPQTPMAAINAFAAENSIDITKDRAEWTKAQEGAMKKYPAAFGIKEGVR